MNRLLVSFFVCSGFAILPVEGVEGLLGYWRLDEGSGDVVADSSGQGNDGVIITPDVAWVEDPVRGTVYQSGNGSYVEFGTFLPVLNAGQDFTWSFWVNPDETDNNNIVFGNRYAPDGSEFAPREFVKFTPRVFEWHFNAIGENVPGTNTMFVIGEWAHNLVVKSGSILMYYRNGASVGSRPITGFPVNPQPLYLGGQNGVEVFSGKFDETAVWDRALTAEEVLEVYWLGLADESLAGTGDDPNLLGPPSTGLGQVASVPAQHSGVFPVRNSGAQQSLTIESIAVGGDDGEHFSITTALPVTINPGQQVEIAYIFDSLGRSGGFSAWLEFESNDPGNPLTRIDVSASILNQEGPIAHFRLNEDEGSAVMRDASGYGRDGTYESGPGVLTLGVPGLADDRAMEVSGNAQSRVDGAELGGLSSFTITVWVAGDTMSGELQTLIGRGTQSPVFAILVRSGGLLWLQGDEGDPLVASDEGLLETDQIYHVGVVADDTAGSQRVSLFIDAEEVARLEDPPRVPDEPGSPLFAGAFNAALGFAGRLDDVQIYDRALSSEDLRTLFENPGLTLGNTTSIDSDGDSLSDEEEVDLGTDPLRADTDRDSLEDGAEVHDHGTSPLLKDSDADGADDRFELWAGTDPNEVSDVPDTSALEGLLGYWRFEEGLGEFATDSSGNGNSGTIVNANAAWVLDEKRGGVYLSGGGSYIDFGAILPVLDLEQDFTWSFFVNSNETANNNIVLGNRYMADGNDFDPREFIKFTPTVFEWHFGGAGQNTPSENTAFVIGRWDHNLVVKDGASLTYYRNGEVIAEGAITGAPVNAQPFYLGGQTDGTGAIVENFSGLFDEVALFARALTAGDVETVYQRGLSGIALMPSPQPPADVPEISGITKTEDGVELQFPAGTVYDVEYSEDVENWETIATGVSGSFTDTDVGRVSKPDGYYRGVVR